MTGRYKKHLATLLDPDIDIYVKKTSAEYFLQEAEKGVDISNAAKGLEELYFESHQVPCMEPAADALFTHYLNQDETGKIDDFIARDELKLFSLAAAGRVAVSRGLDKILPFVVTYFNDENYVVFSIIKDYIHIHKNEQVRVLEGLAKIMAENQKVRPVIPFVLREGAIEKIDMTPFLPVMLPLLTGKSKKEREDAGSALRWSVESNTDFTGIVTDLEKLLETESDISGAIGYCLAYFYVKNKQYDNVNIMIHRSNRDIRKNAFRAIAVRLNNDSKNDKKLLPLLLQGFCDTEETIRKYVGKALLEIQRNNIPILPDKKNLNLFLETLKGPGDNDESYHYLYTIASKENTISKEVLRILSQDEFQASVTASLLQESLRDFENGKFSPVCSICSNIPRNKGYIHEMELPHEAKKLGLEIPSLGEYASTPVCPECGNLYYYSYCQEYDDMSLDTSIELRRLDINETACQLEGQKKEDYIEKIPKLLEELTNDLNHPVAMMRDEAAWRLSRYALEKQLWSLLEMLVKHPVMEVRSEAFHEISKRGANGIPFKQFAESLEDGVGDPDSAIRRESAILLTDKARDDKDYEKLKELLDGSDPVVLASVIQTLWKALKNTRFSLEPLARQLHEHSISEDKTVRRYALYCIKDGNLSAGMSPMELVLHNLENNDPEIRGDALFTLGTMAKEGEDISRAVPLIAAQLDDTETAWKANDVLSKAVYWAKMDITPALEMVLEKIKDIRCSIRKDLVFTLTRGMQENGLDISAGYEILGALLNENDPQIRTAPIELFEEAMRRGENLSIIEPFLNKYLKQRNLTDYYGEFVVKTLTYIYLGKKEWKPLIKLLARKNKNIPGPAASFVTDVLKKGYVDISEILPVLACNLARDYWYIRDTAERALEAFAGYNSFARDSIVKALNETGDLNDKQQELLIKLEAMDYPEGETGSQTQILR